MPLLWNNMITIYGPWGCPWSPKQPTDLLIRSCRSLQKYINRFDFYLIGCGSIPNCCWWAVFCSSRACCLSLSPSSFCPSRAARCAVSDVWISCMCLVFRLLSISYKQKGKYIIYEGLCEPSSCLGGRTQLKLTEYLLLVQKVHWMIKVNSVSCESRHSNR